MRKREKKKKNKNKSKIEALQLNSNFFVFGLNIDCFFIFWYQMLLDCVLIVLSSLFCFGG